jgi:hypothetical protein
VQRRKKVYRPNEREAGIQPGVDIERGREFWIICRKRVPKRVQHAVIKPKRDLVVLSVINRWRDEVLCCGEQQMWKLLRFSTYRKGGCVEIINSRRGEKNLLRASTNGLWRLEKRCDRRGFQARR